ncbi:hypothetical protein ACVWWR_003988 [Bradyrhizobium sp. LM3.2]
MRTLPHRRNDRKAEARAPDAWKPDPCRLELCAGSRIGRARCRREWLSTVSRRRHDDARSVHSRSRRPCHHSLALRSQKSGCDPRLLAHRGALPRNHRQRRADVDCRACRGADRILRYQLGSNGPHRRGRGSEGHQREVSGANRDYLVRDLWHDGNRSSDRVQSRPRDTHTGQRRIQGAVCEDQNRFSGRCRPEARLPAAHQRPSSSSADRRCFPDTSTPGTTKAC